MTPKEFFDKVVEMRRCQKEYFKNKRQIDLHEKDNYCGWYAVRHDDVCNNPCTRIREEGK